VLFLGVQEMWDKFFNFILGECNKDVIFVQNLGAFDGFFLYKALSNKFKAEEVSCLIDSENKLIQIIPRTEKRQNKPLLCVVLLRSALASSSSSTTYICFLLIFIRIKTFSLSFHVLPLLLRWLRPRKNLISFLFF